MVTGLNLCRSLPTSKNKAMTPKEKLPKGETNGNTVGSELVNFVHPQTERDGPGQCASLDVRTRRCARDPVTGAGIAYR